MSKKNKEKAEGELKPLTGFKRAIPVILFAVALFITLCFFTKGTGAVGGAIGDFLLGCFSIGGYFIPALFVLHAFLFPSDVQNKKLIPRIIFSIFLLLTVSTLVNAIQYFSEDPSFNYPEAYELGMQNEGGGFIGGAIGFILSRVIGNIGIIIFSAVVFIFYAAYIFSGKKNPIKSFFCKITYAFLKFGAKMEARIKRRKEEKKKRKAEKLEAERIAKEKRDAKRAEAIMKKEAELYEDDFFAVDTGLKELKIEELGISEFREDADIEKNPTLQEKVHVKSEVECEDEYVNRPKKDVNVNYGLEDLEEITYGAEEGEVEEYSGSDLSSAASGEPTMSEFGLDDSPENVFTKDFQAYDFEANEKLAYKASSRGESPAPEAIPEEKPTRERPTFSQEDIEAARKRADFEYRKSLLVKNARERNEIKAEPIPDRGYQAPAASKSEPEITVVLDGKPSESDTPYRDESIAEKYKRTAGYASVINEQPAKSDFSEFKREGYNRPEPNYEPNTQYTPAATISFNNRPNPLDNPKYYTPAETIKATQTENKGYSAHSETSSFEEEILKSVAREYEAASQASVYGEGYGAKNGRLEFEFETSSANTNATQIFDFSAAEDIPTPKSEPTTSNFAKSEEENPRDNYQNATVNTYSPTVTESVPEPADDDEEEYGEELSAQETEIPEEKQNPEINEYRKMFSIFDEKDEDEKANVTLPATAPASSFTDEGYDNEELEGDESGEDIEAEFEVLDPDEEEDDLPPFEGGFAALPKPQASVAAYTEKPKQEKPDYSNFEFPPIDLLAKGEDEMDSSIEEEIQENADKLIDALGQFNVRASVKSVDRGPRITRYEIVPARGVRVNSVINLFDDIALHLAAEGIRMEAPIPGKSAIGVEIPNKHPSTVLLRELLESEEFRNEHSKTYCCVGKDVAGSPVFGDIAKMPHVLIAGATGMGKSVCINSILISILYKARPDEVKFIMIDPKTVEFTMYNGIPHLLVPVVTDVKQAAGALMWAIDEMNRRYELMAKHEVRKLESYNEIVKANPELGDPLPKIIIVIDELNDLMQQVRKPVEGLITSITQKARAAGIHMIIGTQRPSVDVITGVIKANVPSRVSCKVTSFNDSKTILDQAGAEKLLDKGDMLFFPVGKPKPIRVQGAFVSDSEVEKIMRFLKSNVKGNIYDEEALMEMTRAAQKCNKDKDSDSDFDDDGDSDAGSGYLSDKQFLEAVDLAIKQGKISTSLIQRKIRLGYGKAAKFIDVMEELGIVSEPNGQKPRDVLVTREEWHEMLSRRSLDD